MGTVMRVRASRRPARRLASAAAVGLAASLVSAVNLVAPAVTLAAEPVTFGTPSIEGSFGQPITFTQPVTLAAPLGRAELLLTFADASGPTIVPVDPPSGTGGQMLTDTQPTSGVDHLLPNTPLRARWRLTATDGTTMTGPEARIVYADDRFGWRTASGPLVTVHWYQGDAAFGQRALRIAGDAIAASGALLGVTETDPVDFFVYADEQAFRDALGPGTRENVGGQADADIRTLFALITPADIDAAWVGIVIPHELTHLVFDTASRNPYHFPPRWLNEGLAVYQAQGYDPSDQRLVQGAIRARTMIPLTGLAGQFPTDVDGFSQAYAESVSAVDYLIRTDGRAALVKLIRSYSSGLTDDEAFTAAVGKDVTAFSDAWLEDLGTSAPARIGPVAAPPGPLPSDWGGPRATLQPGGGSTAGPATVASGSAPSASGPAAPDAATAGAGSDLGTGLGVVLVVAVVVVIGAAAIAAYRRRGRGTGSPPAARAR